MTIEDVGSIGELVAAIATVATLFYLAMQIRHGAEATRAASQQALLDTFFAATWELGRDMELARVVGAGLSSYETLCDRDKTAFTLVLSRYVGNLEKGLRLREARLIDQETLDSVGNALVASLLAPGGAAWWKDYRRVSPPIVVDYLEPMVAVAQQDGDSWVERFPYWARWAKSATLRIGDSDAGEARGTKSPPSER